MSFKSFAAKQLAKIVRKRIDDWAKNPAETQHKVLRNLIQKAENTAFGREHGFKDIHDAAGFAKRVPIRDYEGIKPYIERIIAGEKNILWPGKPLYFAKTSGTTSGAKHIPLTRESMPEHIKAARNAILCYIAETGNAQFVDGKMIFLQGSPEMDKKGNIPTGRLSGITAHYVPSYLQKNRLPSWETNCIEDWETKVDKIIEETLPENMTIISGIPSWVQMYFEKIREKTGKKIGEVFPNFNLFIYGGVNFEPYRSHFENLIGRKVDSIELFPASEGFFAFQDKQNHPGMLLLLDSGIFYEFIKVDEFYEENPKRHTIDEVELDTNYAMLISTSAGLWGYNLGDTVKFVSLKPHKIIVSGRMEHFISAFGEHVIAMEVEKAMKTASEKWDVQIVEFTVAPQTNPKEGLPHHEWFIEFEKEPSDIEGFSEEIDLALQKQNSYYFDLISGKILKRLKITKIQKNGFRDYMASIGKLGGQNKIPRLSNDRKMAEDLAKYIV